MNQRQTNPNNSSSRSSGTPTTTNPLSKARERLQTSARELFRSFEDAVLVPQQQDAENNNHTSDTRNRRLAPTLRDGAASIDHALRVMFSSCTGASEVGRTPEEPLVALQQFQTVTTTPAKDSTVFNHITTPPTASTTSPHNSSHHRHRSPSQRRDSGEHIYAQLFHDNADKAVEITTRRGYETPEPQQDSERPRALSKPFPISTPPRSFSAPSQELHVPASLTFDDAISCISAHTLEAMVDPPPPRSKPTTTTTTTITSQFHKESLLLSEPNSLVRVRSSGSRFSLPSKGNNSRQSKTTQTTESSGSSFDVWQAQEQKFWHDMVHDGHPHDTSASFGFDEDPFLHPVVREDISYLIPGTFLEEEEFDFADMGEI